jgi:hypothetical protein
MLDEFSVTAEEVFFTSTQAHSDTMILDGRTSVLEETEEEEEEEITEDDIDREKVKIKDMVAEIAKTEGNNCRKRK